MPRPQPKTVIDMPAWRKPLYQPRQEFVVWLRSIIAHAEAHPCPGGWLDSVAVAASWFAVAADAANNGTALFLSRNVQSVASGLTVDGFDFRLWIVSEINAHNPDRVQHLACLGQHEETATP